MLIDHCTRATLCCMVVMAFCLHAGAQPPYVGAEAPYAGAQPSYVSENQPYAGEATFDAPRSSFAGSAGRAADWRSRDARLPQAGRQYASMTADFDPAARSARFDQPVLLPTGAIHRAPITASPRTKLASEDAWSVQWLPGSLIYKSYLAGVKESRFSGAVTTGRSNIVGSNWLLDGTLGARVGVWRYGTRHDILAQGFQLDVEGSAQLRMDLTDEMDVIATDYRIGVPLTFGVGMHQFKFAYYHLSSHLGDEYLVKRPSFPRLNFLRDVLVLGWSYYLNPDLRVYGEAGWAFKSEISEPWEFQFGLDWAPGCPTGSQGAPFFAVNVHLREEVSFGGHITAQAGWAWRAEEDARLLRLGVQYLNGLNPQFSFYQFHENHLSLGLWYDF